VNDIGFAQGGADRMSNDSRLSSIKSADDRSVPSDAVARRIGASAMTNAWYRK
jgi:hypothetical protein